MKYRYLFWMSVVVAVGCGSAERIKPAKSQSSIHADPSQKPASVDLVSTEQLHSGERGLNCYTVESCEIACNNKLPWACVRLSNMYSSEWVTTHDEAAGKKILEKGCSQGDGFSCVMLYAWAKNDGLDLQQISIKHQKAISVSEAGCKNGYYTDCVARARIADVPLDGTVNIRAILSACQAGSLGHCSSFKVLRYFAEEESAEKLITEEALSQAAAKALQLSDQRCEYGDASACILSHDAHSEEIWMDRALAALQNQCDQYGYGSGCMEVGELLTVSLERPEQGSVYYKKACDMGITAACEEIREPDPRFNGVFAVVDWTVDNGCTGTQSRPSNAFQFIQMLPSRKDEPRESPRLISGCMRKDCSSPKEIAVMSQESSSGWSSGRSWRSVFDGVCKKYERTVQKAWIEGDTMRIRLQEERIPDCLAWDHEIDNTPVAEQKWQCVTLQEYVLSMAN